MNPVTRDEFFQRFVSKSSLGIEIGPSYNPAYPKGQGWNVETIDYLSAEDLKQKYKADLRIKIDQIEAVDYIVEGSNFSQSIPEDRKGQYEFIGLSHALEHLCDIVGFLSECESLLMEGGKVIIAVPDKRFCFDFFRPISTTGDVLRAHWEKRKTHPADVLFDSNNLICSTNSCEEWDQWHAIPKFEFIVEYDQSVLLAASDRVASGEDNAYNDMHRWVFTPSSLLLIFRDLSAIGLSNFETSYIEHGIGPNIFFVLTKNSQPNREFAAKDRMLYQYAILQELRVQQIFIDQAPQFSEALALGAMEANLQNALASNQRLMEDMTKGRR